MGTDFDCCFCNGTRKSLPTIIILYSFIMPGNVVNGENGPILHNIIQGNVEKTSFVLKFSSYDQS